METKKNEIEELKENIRKFNLQVESIEMDGNCLFRAISHQLHGNQNQHFQIRQQCMDYIEKEKIYFQKFIFNEDFDSYILRKRQQKVWGDNIEIQALSEIYNARIEIYHTDKIPIIIYNQEDNPNKIFRLFYRNLVHYDSIIEVSEQNSNKYQQLQKLIEEQKEKMILRNQIISRKNFKDIAKLTMKQMFQRSLKSLKKDEERHIKITTQLSDKQNIEDQILKIVLNESQSDYQQKIGSLTLYEKIINLGFPSEIALKATLRFNNNNNADIEKVMAYIYKDLV